MTSYAEKRTIKKILKQQLQNLFEFAFEKVAQQRHATNQPLGKIQNNSIQETGKLVSHYTDSDNRKKQTT